MKIVHVSDIHFGNEDKAAIAAAEAHIAEIAPDAVLASGDITAIGAADEMEAAFAWLNALPAPAIATPGNHDTPYFSILPRLFDPFGRFRRASTGVATGPFLREDFVIAPVNTARGVQWRKNWALGAISGGQVRACAGVLSAAPHDAVKIVATHHPLIWPPNAPIPGETRGGEAAVRALIDAGADFFLSGHLHVSGVHKLDHNGRTASAVSAGTLSIRHRGEPGGFIVLQSAGDGRVEIERLHLDNGHAVKIGSVIVKLSRKRETVHA